MNDIQRELLRLIAADETTDDPEVLKEAKLQSVFSMVNHTSKLSNQLLARNLVITNAHRDLSALLTEESIPFAILKGVASAAYYPDPFLRTMGDVDLLVRPEDFPKAAAALTAADWMEAEGDNGKHKVYYRDGVTVELHWTVNGVPQGREDIQHLLDDLIPCSVERDGLMLPSPFHHGLVLLLHTAEHLLNTGIGLRHLCDWAYFAAALPEEAFADLFEASLRSVGLWRFAQLLTLVSVRYLGIPPRRWAECGCEDALLDDLMDDILNAGNFGVKDAQRLNQAKLIHADGQVQDHALFPALAHKTKMELPACKAHPVLLPGGMVYIAVRHLLRIRAGKRAGLDLSRMVSGAKERRSLYRQLHLFESETVLPQK